MGAPLPPRIARQKAIEDAIENFYPDASEAQEILDALTSRIKARYEDAGNDALEHANLFREALDELDRTTSFEPDPYDTMVAKEAA